MTGLSDKLKLIYKPLVIIAICFVIAYTFLHWALFIKAEISLKEDIIKFWLPIGLSAIPTFFWLRPTIKLLHFENENTSFLYQFLASLAIAAPTIVAQEYLVTATGKLSQLENVSFIEKAEKTKYYTLKNYYIDKQRIAIQSTATVSGRYDTDLNMLIYIAMPIFESPADSTKKVCKYWLGKKYTEQISNSLSDEEKEAKYRLFALQTEKEFGGTYFGNLQYLEVMANSDDRDEFNTAIEKSEQVKGNQQVIFTAQTEPFENRNGMKLAWVFGALAIGLFVYFIFLLFAKFDEEKLADFKQGYIEKDNDLKEIFDFLTPREDFFITPILVNINLLVFFAMMIAGFGFMSFKAEYLLNWGANYKPSTTDGQWWRLLTNIFMHGGLIHVVANMSGLLFIGIILEPLLGKTKYLLLYLATGIVASLASIWWYDATVSVGASGAIFGLYGFFLALLLLKVFPPEFGYTFLTSTLIFIGFNLLMGLMGSIDNAAHIGGLISGFIFGLMMAKQFKGKI